MSNKDELFLVAGKAREIGEKIQTEAFSAPLDALEDVANQVGKAWSGSWLGYHSLVYYQDLEAPPPGARFSQEWGLQQSFAIRETIGEWHEVAYDDMIRYIGERAGATDITAIEKEVANTIEIFEDLKSTVVSRLSMAVRDDPDDKYIDDLLAQAKESQICGADAYIKLVMPRGPLVSRDSVAIHKGLCTPPHIAILAKVFAIRQPFVACTELSKIAQRAASHLSDRNEKIMRQSRIGTNVFIGHGRDHAWKDLRDFVRDRLHLPWDEFNRVPVAGFTNIARLSQMLDGAAIAFIILTAEDERADGKYQARMNVIHEAGLFQGRLGFERAILVLEEGCEEFSNVQGLGQIRFPAGNITAVFEQIRQVLEREELL